MAGKMAQAFSGSLTALYVQTPGDADMNAEDTVRLQANMRLAQQLGAEIVTTHGEDVATQIAEYVRLSDVTKIVIGRSGVQRRHFWSEPTLEKIAPRCGRARFGLGALRNATVPVRNAIPAITNEGRCANTGLRWLWGTVTGIPCFSGRKEPFRASRIFYCYTKDIWKRCRSPVRTGACGRRVRGPC